MKGYQQYFIEEFVEDYRENRLSRRDLLKRVLFITGSIPATASVLLALGCRSREAAQTPAPPPAAPATATAPAAPTVLPAGVTVPPTDPAIEARDVRFPGPASDLLGYLSRPRAGGLYPGILVIHENRGLVEHIKDVTRRYAKEGFVALAVDLVSRQGGTEQVSDTNEVTGFLGRANPDDFITDLRAGINYLKEQPFVRPDAIGVTGFCFGGGYTWEMAIASPDVKAAVPYYGSIRRLDELSRTRAAILAIYGSEDTRITAQAPAVEERLRAAGVPFEIKIYPGANHAFFNDTGPRYHEAAARDAWQQTLAWFRRYLTG